MAAGDYTGYASELAWYAGGMCLSVARAWLQAEGGGPGANNPLNIRCTGSGLDQSYTGPRCTSFANYPSIAVGLQAAAWELQHNSRYSGVISAIHSGSCADQAKAIIESPWAGGHYGGLGGHGPLQAIAGGGSGGSYPTVSPNVAQFLAISPSTAFTDALAQRAAAKYAGINGGSYGPAYQGAYNDIYAALRVWEQPGVTAGDVPFNVDSAGHNTGAVVVPSPDQQASGDTNRGSVVPDVAGAIAKLPDEIVTAVSPLLANLAILVVVVILTKRGLEELLAA